MSKNNLYLSLNLCEKVFFVIFLMFILPSQSSELSVKLPVFATDVGEKSPLLAGKEQSQSDVILQIDLTKEYSPLHPIPMDIFWYIMFLSDDHMIRCLGVSKSFHEQLHKIVPPFLLDRSPSCLQVVKFLRTIEYCEEKYQELRKSGFEFPYYPSYDKQILRLWHAAELVRYSPYFWQSNGFEHVDNIAVRHNIAPPQPIRSIFEEISLRCSYVVRDPYVLSIAAPTLTAFTAGGCWAFLNSAIPYFDEKIKAEAIYQQEYQKNLAYAESQAFIDATIHTMQFKPSGCWHSCFRYSDPFICMNDKVRCQPDLLLNSTIAQNMIDGINKVCAPAPLLSIEDLVTALTPTLNQACQTNSHSWEDFMRPIRKNSTILLTGDVISHWMDCDNKHPGQVMTNIMISSVVAPDFPCVARALTPWVTVPIPSPLVGWGVGEIMVITFFITGFWMGWGLFV